MDRVEPYCVISQIMSAFFCICGDRPGPSWPNTRTLLRGSDCRFDRYRARKVVDPNDLEILSTSPGHERVDVAMVMHMLIAIGHHCPAPVPAALAHDVNCCGHERIGVADNGPDIEIVLPVLDRDVKRVSTRIEVVDYRVHRPVAVLVDDVSRVAVREELWVKPRVIGPRLGMGADRHAPGTSSKATTE